MRAWIAVLLSVVFVGLLLPRGVHAAATPVLLWPPSGYESRDAAANLTAWFAGRLGSAPDPGNPPRWEPANRSGDPEFLTPKEAYVLPLANGTARASYLADGLLFDVRLESNTSYVAPSANDGDLRALAFRLAEDLRLDANGSDWGLEYVVANPGTPQERRAWLVSLEASTDLGRPYGFNGLLAAVREPDLRVTMVRVSAWYRPSGAPDIPASEAIAIAMDAARSRFNASDPRAETDAVAVRNGTSFAYLVYVAWPAAEPDCSWTARVWVDATTGEAVHADEPSFACGDAPLIVSPWIPLAAAMAGAALVAVALFLHLNATRALDQFTRGEIVGYLRAHPGAPYTQVRTALGLSNGTLAYHLWVLERLGFVRSVRRGKLRLLRLEGVEVRRGSLPLSRLQLAILDALNAKGPSSQADIARHLGISKQRLGYNVKVLRSLGFLQTAEDGRIGLSAGGAEVLEEGRSSLAPSTAEA